MKNFKWVLGVLVVLGLLSVVVIQVQNNISTGNKASRKEVPQTEEQIVNENSEETKLSPNLGEDKLEINQNVEMSASDVVLNFATKSFGLKLSNTSDVEDQSLYINKVVLDDNVNSSELNYSIEDSNFFYIKNEDVYYLVYPSFKRVFEYFDGDISDANYYQVDGMDSEIRSTINCVMNKANINGVSNELFERTCTYEQKREGMAITDKVTLPKTCFVEVGNSVLVFDQTERTFGDDYNLCTELANLGIVEIVTL